MAQPARPSHDYAIQIPGVGTVDFVNVTPHAFVKYPQAAPEASATEQPEWSMEPSGFKIDAIDGRSDFEAVGREYVVLPPSGPSRDIVISDAPNYVNVRVFWKASASGEWTPVEDGERVLEYLRGKAVMCSAITASVLGDFARFGVHAFIPNSDARASKRNAQGQIVGVRGLFNATRYPLGEGLMSCVVD